jgi:D-alanyl-D-alanine dipeptidase
MFFDLWTMKLYYFLFMVSVFISCSSKKADKETMILVVQDAAVQKEDSTSNSLENESREKEKDSILRTFKLIDVQTLNPQIKVDLKYAGTDNFMGIRLYERIQKAYLQEDVAARLAKCQEFLTSIDPNLHLLVYDAVRPVSVQFKMWNALDSIPVARRGKFVSSPYGKSVHNYGAAVDLTICNAAGVPLDMGAGFDDIREIAYPSKEAFYLAKGELTKEHIQNRELLRKVMRSQGFRNLQTEWWHFNACSREEASKKYILLEVEP